MKTYFGIEKLRPGLFRRPVVTIGNFDGVHRGHQRVIARVVEEARERGVQSIAFTFEPHPVKVLNPGRELRLIYPYEEKNKLIAARGVNAIIVQKFDLDLARTPAETFVADVLVKLLDVQKVIVGYDFNFGRGGNGSAYHLREIAAAKGFDFEVEQVGVYQIDGEIVSSSHIRQHLTSGNLARVGKLLGRPFHLRGSVVHGEGRGKKLLGFPTANLSVQQELIPHDGVYLGRVRIEDRTYDALVNVGDNPTFGVNPVVVEAFILDFNAQIYESAIDIIFLERLRDEMRFRGPEELKAQMEQDLQKAKVFFRNHSKRDD